MHPAEKFPQKTRLVIAAIEEEAKRHANARTFDDGAAAVKEMAGTQTELLDYACADLIAAAYYDLSTWWSAPHAAGILLDGGANIFKVNALLDAWPSPASRHSAPNPHKPQQPA